MAERKMLLPIAAACILSLSASGFFFNIDSLRVVRAIDKEGYVVSSPRVIRWWQVSGELRRDRREAEDPTLRLRVCKLRKGRIPGYVYWSGGPDDYRGTREQLNDRMVCYIRV